MVRWAVELSEFDIQYEPRGCIKGQVYADFVAELSPGGEQEVEAGSQWLLSVDGSSNQQGCGAGIVLEGPNGVLIEQALRFAFKASNNQAEYEVLVAGMLPADYRTSIRRVPSKRPADGGVFEIRPIAEGSV